MLLYKNFYLFAIILFVYFPLTKEIREKMSAEGSPTPRGFGGQARSEPLGVGRSTYRSLGVGRQGFWNLK
jgi:hypothetical protein